MLLTRLIKLSFPKAQIYLFSRINFAPGFLRFIHRGRGGNISVLQQRA